MHILDDQNYIHQLDPRDALGVAAREAEQLCFNAVVEQGTAIKFEPENIIVAGMGGSALAAGMAKNWLRLPVPFEVVRRYDVPAYVSKSSLVIASSYSGNTEETLSALENARKSGAKVAIIAAGGKLLEVARAEGYPYVQLVSNLQPRMAVLYNLKALIVLLDTVTGLGAGKDVEITQAATWLQEQIKQWTADVPFERNNAKQWADHCAGKTPVVYAGSLMAPIAYKWKISFNENAKNVAFTNELPEFNHNEFIGWTSHPIEKPYAVFDLISNFEHSQILKRFTVSDRLLSGMRPRAVSVELQGDTLLQQMVWGSVLGDFVSIYLALLNGINPTPVALIEKLKAELARS